MKKNNDESYSAIVYEKITRYLDSIEFSYHTYPGGKILFRAEENVYNVLVKETEFIVFVIFGKTASNNMIFKELNDINTTLLVGSIHVEPESGKLFLRYPVIFEGNGEDVSEELIARSLLVPELIISEKSQMLNFTESSFCFADVGVVS